MVFFLIKNSIQKKKENNYELHKSICFNSFTSGWPVFPAPLVKGIVFSPLYSLASFVKDKVSIGAWIYLWAFYFVPLTQLLSPFQLLKYILIVLTDFKQLFDTKISFNNNVISVS